MSAGDLTCRDLINGHASRYIRSRWYSSGNLSTEAFDLREGPPPETYVSHFLTEGSGSQLFTSAYALISQRLTCNDGSIAVLNIVEALSEINDEVKPLIKFVEKGLPHCGLIYVTTSQQQIQEAKATLCLLAKKRLASVTDILREVENDGRKGSLEQSHSATD